MAGYSPALLKFIFSGELGEEIEEAVLSSSGEAVVVRRKKTPLEHLVTRPCGSRRGMR